MAARDTGKCPKSIYDFDEQFTAPLGGFASAKQYYATCSALPILKDIRVPTLILASKDDPLIPFSVYEAAELSASSQLYASEYGGHVGFMGRKRTDPDRWWLDWRIVDWILAGCNHSSDA